MVNEGIDCGLQCPVPEGFEVTEVPVPGHFRGDVMVCPNGEQDGLAAPCGRAFLITVRPAEEDACVH